MTESTSRVSVQIVDDHFLFASALAGVIKEIDRYRLVGIAVTGPQALAMVREEQPDIVLLDFHLPGYSADTLLPRFLAVSPSTKVIVLTSDTSEAAMQSAVRAGATGFMTKDKAIDDVLDALGIVAGGGSLLTAAQREIAAASAAQVALWDAETPATTAAAAPATLPRSPSPVLGGSPAPPSGMAFPIDVAASHGISAPSTSPAPRADLAAAPTSAWPPSGDWPQSPAVPEPEPVELRLEGVGSFAQAVLIERFIDRLPQVESSYIRALEGDRASLRVTLGAGESAETLARELVDGSRRLRLMQASPGVLELQIEAPLIDG